MAEQKPEQKQGAGEQAAQALQQMVALYQLLQQHLEQVRTQLAALQKGFVDIETTRQAVDSLGKGSAEAEVLIPLGAGVFTHGTAQGNSSMLVDIGAGVVVEKPPAEILGLIEQKKGELEKLVMQLQAEEAQAAAQLTEIAQQIQKMSG